ncbi:MAG TPA: LacI family DNA-binding transcriptional regulator [Anaerolineae bacterium]|nr:LacI family DNA-binding transcriptional regulator [Anaerolineae bacterium]
MHVTLQDVARQAGVSTKTVSRVVNNQGEISETTRQRVQAAIEQLGYYPNILARSLVNQRSNTLAVVAWGIDYYGPSRILVGIEKKSDELGYSLFLNLLARPDDSHIDRILDMLIARRVEGILWAVPEVGNNRAWIATARLDSLPPVVFVSMASRPGLTTVSIDNRHGAAQATQHLIDQSPRHIGMITGPLTWWEARERQAGWQAALQKAGLTPAPALVVEGDWSAASGDRAMRLLLDREPAIDAVFVCSDQMALGALGAAHQAGRKVPQDLIIAGFDNIPESAFFWPPLTTVYQQLVDAGGIAVQNLHQVIEGRRKDNQHPQSEATILTPELVIRESSVQR